MKSATCPRCGKSWSVLPDGTLVEHPQPEIRALLCSGSRSRAPRDPRKMTGGDAVRPARRRRVALSGSAAGRD
jgi:hypothetical protein